MSNIRDHKQPLTAGQLLTRLEKLFIDYPETIDYPVHMLIMDEEGDSLLTDIETDSFEPDSLRMVVSLIADTSGKLGGGLLGLDEVRIKMRECPKCHKHAANRIEFTSLWWVWICSECGYQFRTKPRGDGGVLKEDRIISLAEKK